MEELLLVEVVKEEAEGVEGDEEEEEEWPMEEMGLLKMGRVLTKRLQMLWKTSLPENQWENWRVWVQEENNTVPSQDPWFRDQELSKSQI